MRPARNAPFFRQTAVGLGYSAICRCLLQKTNHADAILTTKQTYHQARSASPSRWYARVRSPNWHRKMNTIKREFSVAFSPRAQPVWLRVTKWIVIIGVTCLLRRTPYFWFWVLGLPALGLVVHFFIRWKTHGWTKPWGGWNDVRPDRG